MVVVDDTGCSVGDKQDAAIAKGAVGLLVVSAPGPSGSPTGLFTPGYYQRLLPLTPEDGQISQSL